MYGNVYFCWDVWDLTQCIVYTFVMIILYCHALAKHILILISPKHFP